MQLNEIYFCGNAGRDAVSRGFGNGSGQVVEFSLCYSYKNKNGEAIPTWVEVKVFGDDKRKYWCEQAQKIKKGDNVFAKGRLSVNEYEKDGAKRKSVEIVADIISILEKDRGEPAAPKVSGNSVVQIDLETIPF